VNYHLMFGIEPGSLGKPAARSIVTQDYTSSASRSVSMVPSPSSPVRAKKLTIARSAAFTSTSPTVPTPQESPRTSESSSAIPSTS